MSSITIDALRIYPKASLSPSDRLISCKNKRSKSQASHKKSMLCYIILESDESSFLLFKLNSMILMHGDRNVILF